MTRHPNPMTPYRLPLIACVLLACALLLAACDSVEPATDGPGSEATAALSTLAAGKVGKVEVCHVTSDPATPYVFIEIADPAYEAHVAHGDASPGQPVPGQEGFVFDEACEPVAVTASCPCFNAADLDGLSFDPATTLLTDHPVSFVSSPRVTVLGQPNETGGALEKSVFAGFYPRETPSCGFADEDTQTETYIGDISLEEVEACRVLIYDEAADLDITCQGDNCGESYTP